VKLSGHRNRWRIRAGDYRIVYEIHDAEVWVIIVAVGHRRDVYRGM
jgi:mRNA interferase RelE/StbE